ncbi:hypothetical protein LNKW23_02530 [Paralimibaculum aggregatum]|uniref:Lipoprotein n=2 Tax=Paralimibaculum aggregatum TaxID=3036245 RepID=A0ABQ6LF84_9RHOB|nr:hypothetical protein LNKW23_02530 [Limibaculum sp. NKW23]
MRIKWAGRAAVLALAGGLAACGSPQQAEVSLMLPGDKLEHERVEMVLDYQTQGLLAPGCALQVSTTAGAYLVEAMWETGYAAYPVQLDAGRHKLLALTSDGRIVPVGDETIMEICDMPPAPALQTE